MFYSESPKWHAQIGEIHALLERVKISEEQSSSSLRLRRLNRIMSIHASISIEGNCLTVEQVSDAINGAPVWGPPRDIKEAQNAWRAYGLIPQLDPWKIDDFLKAHAAMTEALISESGAFRSVEVAVVGANKNVLHRGSPPDVIAELMSELFDWGEQSEAHPLIVSSAAHYMVEHIHPFRDGNGRMGRLWQTLILSKWNPLFAWMPVETVVYDEQAQYYKALQESHEDGIDCRPFIDFMLQAIKQSLHKFVETSKKTQGGTDPINDPINRAGVLAEIKADPRITYDRLAARFGSSTATVKRALQKLKQEGAIRRVGSNKTGYWEILSGDK